jgi:hypothetical protein
VYLQNRDVKHLGLLGWWAGLKEEYKKRKGCKKDNFGWFCAIAGFFAALAPLEMQAGSSLDFAFTFKNQKRKSKIQCAERVCWGG